MEARILDCSYQIQFAVSVQITRRKSEQNSRGRSHLSQGGILKSPIAFAQQNPQRAGSESARIDVAARRQIQLAIAIEIAREHARYGETAYGIVDRGPKRAVAAVDQDRYAPCARAAGLSLKARRHIRLAVAVEVTDRDTARVCPETPTTRKAADWVTGLRAQGSIAIPENYIHRTAIIAELVRKH